MRDDCTVQVNVVFEQQVSHVFGKLAAHDLGVHVVVKALFGNLADLEPVVLHEELVFDDVEGLHGHDLAHDALGEDVRAHSLLDQPSGSRVVVYLVDLLLDDPHVDLHIF